MRSVIFGSLVMVLAVVAGSRAADDRPQNGSSPPAEQDVWQVLFDGKNLDAWDTSATADSWKINDQGELFVAKRGPNLFTRQRYCDFVLELDFKVIGEHKSNSGVFVRVHDKKDEVHTGMEIQILDNAGYNVAWNAMNANGALYDMVHPAIDATNPVGEWNHYRITVNGSKIVVELNGKEIVEADLDRWTTAHQNPGGAHNKYRYPMGALPHEGFIGLQNYGGVPVWFRNIRLKLLSDRKAQFTGEEPITQVLKQAEPAKK